MACACLVPKLNSNGGVVNCAANGGRMARKYLGGPVMRSAGCACLVPRFVSNGTVCFACHEGEGGGVFC